MHRRAVAAGTATLITSDGPLTITFDPDTMQVSNPIEHCAGFDRRSHFGD